MGVASLLQQPARSPPPQTPRCRHSIRSRADDQTAVGIEASPRLHFRRTPAFLSRCEACATHRRLQWAQSRHAAAQRGEPKPQSGSGYSRQQPVSSLQQSWRRSPPIRSAGRTSRSDAETSHRLSARSTTASSPVRPDSSRDVRSCSKVIALANPRVTLHRGYESSRSSSARFRYPFRQVTR